MREWLKEIRLSKHMTQNEIAEKAELSQNYYANIENGKRRPAVETAKAIAGVLNFDWQRFYE